MPFALILFSSQREDELEEYYRNKYGQTSVAARFGEGEEMSDEITQQGLLPGVKLVFHPISLNILLLSLNEMMRIMMMVMMITLFFHLPVIFAEIQTCG